VSEDLSYNVRIWKTETYRGAKVTTYSVRWKVGPKRWRRAFRIAAQADSFRAELLAAAQRAVTEGRAENVSAWVNDALRLKTDHDRRLQALDDFLAAYEAEHGEITEEEMRDATRRARERAIIVRGRPDEYRPTERGRGAA